MLRAAFALVIVVVLCTNGAVAASLSPNRQAELKHLLIHDCGSCHGLTLKGGLGPALLPGDLRSKTDDTLIEVVLDGVPGTPMPPWRSELTPEEASWLVALMKSGVPQ